MALDSQRVVVIQKRRTGLFLAAKNAWTQDVQEAWHFAMGVDAYEFACDQHLFDCDILIRPHDAAPDIRVPVHAMG